MVKRVIRKSQTNCGRSCRVSYEAFQGKLCHFEKKKTAWGWYIIKLYLIEVTCS